METELKFVIDAKGAARLRADLGLPDEGERLRSVYFDTPHLDLKSAGFVLRVREEDGRRVQTIKQANGSLFTRHEWETCLSQDQAAADEPARDGLDFAAIDETPLGACLGARRRKALAPVFEVDVRRAKSQIEFAGAQIEAALDEGEVRTVGHRTPIRELELELKSGHPAALFALARTLKDAALTLSFLTKSARGFALARDGAVYAAALAPPPLKGDQSAADGLRAVAAACLAQIAAHAEILRLREDSEAIHQLRVGARRLRSTLSLFRALMSDEERERVSDELRWLARSCDGARDLDVFIKSRFAPMMAAETRPERLAAFAAVLEQRRARAHDQARQTVASPRFRGLLLETAAWIEGGEWTRDNARAVQRDKPLKTFAAKVLDQADHRVAKRAKALKSPDDRPRHRLRVADKTLRFAASVLSPAFEDADPARIKAFGKAATKAQNALGAVTDIVSARALCSQIAEDEGRSDPDIAFAAGYVAGQIAASGPEKLKAARKAVRALRKAEPFW